ncbi:MAG: amidase family protein [Vicinamibacterales bacterium]
MPSGRSLPHEPATDILRSIAEGHVSAAEAVQAHLDQIDRLEPQLNAFVDVRGEAALAEARAQDDAAARGEARGSLGGLPVSVKSAFEVTGRHHVEPFRPDGLDRARQLWDVFSAEAGLLTLDETLHGAERGLPILKAFMKGDAPLPPLTSKGFIQAWADRDTLRAHVLRQMASHRVLLCPVASIPAFRHGERSWMVEGTEVEYLDAMTYTHWCNVLGYPAVVVPAGTSAEGLPIGVQVVGRPYEEELLLAVAAQIERELGGYTRPPIS